MTRPACVLCGSDVEVGVSLIEWREPINGRRFESVPRCRNRRTCRERVALLGEPWPAADSHKPEPVVAR